MIAAILGALALSAAAALAEPPTFRAGVESVYVDVFVMRDGAAVTGLDASQFELRDDGRPQQVELVAVEDMPLTTLLVFDASDSVRGEKLAALRAAAGAFLDGLRPRDEVGLLAFTEEMRWLARPSADKEVARAALSGLSAQGASAVWDAVSAAITVLPTASRAMVVVFSDGQDNMSWLDAARVQAQAARSNVLVQAVGISAPSPLGEPAHVEDLRRLAEMTGGQLWPATSPERLGAAFRGIIEAMNTRYVLRYDPGPDAKPGQHRIEVRLKGVKGEVRARQGYWRAK